MSRLRVSAARAGRAKRARARGVWGLFVCAEVRIRERESESSLSSVTWVTKHRLAPWARDARRGLLSAAPSSAPGVGPRGARLCDLDTGHSGTGGGGGHTMGATVQAPTSAPRGHLSPAVSVRRALRPPATDERGRQTRLCHWQGAGANYGAGGMKGARWGEERAEPEREKSGRERREKNGGERRQRSGEARRAEREGKGLPQRQRARPGTRRRRNPSKCSWCQWHVARTARSHGERSSVFEWQVLSCTETTQLYDGTPLRSVDDSRHVPGVGSVDERWRPARTRARAPQCPTCPVCTGPVEQSRDAPPPPPGALQRRPIPKSEDRAQLLC
ncbi:unnamed protein product [Lampetra fluviatilis]